MPTLTRRRSKKTSKQTALGVALSAELGRLVQAEVDDQLSELRDEVAELRKRVGKAERGGSRRPGPARKASGGQTAASAKLTPDAIRSMRKRLGISQAELALLVGVTPVAVYFWESARTRPVGSNVDALIQLRGLDARRVRRRVDRLK